jgi:hypothetical protein
MRKTSFSRDFGTVTSLEESERMPQYLLLTSQHVSTELCLGRRYNAPVFNML